MIADAPLWHQVTALVSVGTTGVTGMTFVPRQPAELRSPTSLTLPDRSAQAALPNDAAFRSALMLVSTFYLRMAEAKTPAQMEQIIVQEAQAIASKPAPRPADGDEACTAQQSENLASLVSRAAKAAEPYIRDQQPAPPKPARPHHHHHRHKYLPRETPVPWQSGTNPQQRFINQIAVGAIATQREYGVPAAVTIAQAIEESGWGSSELAAKYHNIFGMKGEGPAGSVNLPTQEWNGSQMVDTTADFRVYDNFAQSILDHGQELATSSYYTKAMSDRGDPNTFANDLTGVYATDPNYGTNLIGLMQQYNLYQYDRG